MLARRFAAPKNPKTPKNLGKVLGKRPCKPFQQTVTSVKALSDCAFTKRKSISFSNAIGGNIVQISRNSFTLLAGAAASALILSACGGGSSTPTPTGPVAQTISVAATKATLVTGDTSTLSITQSGTGAKTYALTGGTAQAKCAVNSTTGVLTLAADAAIGGTCIVTGSVAADSSYLAATNTSTITVSPVVASFDEATAPLLNGFDFGIPVLNPAVVIPAGGATITMKVYSPDASSPTMLKLSSGTGADQEVAVNSTAANTWETLSFVMPTAGTYKVMTIFPNGAGAKPSTTKAWYYDDITYPKTGGTTTITFDTAYPTIDSGFEGLVSSAVVASPTASTNQVAKLEKGASGQLWAGANILQAALPTLPQIITSAPGTSSNSVLQINKYTYSQPWAGVTLYKIAADKSVSTIPLTAQKTTMTMKVYSPAVGIRYTVKLENAADGTKNVQTFATSAVANAWETLTFNFANQTSGTAALVPATTYNKISVMPDFMEGAGVALTSDKVYYIDDISFVP